MLTTSAILSAQTATPDNALAPAQKLQGNSAAFETVMDALQANPELTEIVDAELMETAKEFEAAFITQMLTFSGLGEAMVSGEGEMASAFTGFFLESLASDMADVGAFGLADKLYDTLKDRQSGALDMAASAPQSGGLL